MCFSASASFTSAALLFSAGIYCIKKALRFERRYCLFSLFVLTFSLQQFIEGGLWLGLTEDNKKLITLSSHLFLFFSHFLWLVLTPLAVYRLEEGERKKRLFLFFLLTGFIYGLSLYLPLLLNKGWLSVHIVNHSIYYNTTLLYDRAISKDIVTLVYAALIIIPLLLSSNRQIKVFGIMLTLSLIPARLAYYNSFISIWCFFAAILSFYICYIIFRLPKR